MRGENDSYRRLIKRNPTNNGDPLRKVIVIIDEAHKIFDGSLGPLERPNIELLHSGIQKSYNLSKKNSVRLIFLTATPIINDGMDLVHMLNMMIPLKKDKLPHNFELFKEKYLDDDGTFKSNMKNTFQNKVAGLISYLDRTKDPTQFAQARYKTISVPLSTLSSTKSISNLNEDILEYKDKLLKSKERFEKKKKKYLSDIKLLKSNKKKKIRKIGVGGYFTPKTRKSFTSKKLRQFRKNRISSTPKKLRQFRKNRISSTPKKLRQLKYLSSKLNNKNKKSSREGIKNINSLKKKLDKTRKIFKLEKFFLRKKIKSFREEKKSKKKSIKQSQRLKLFCKLNL